MNALKDINIKLVKVTLLLEECTNDLKALNSELNDVASEVKDVNIKSNRFVFGE